jgi:polyphosphate kinase
MTLSYLNGLRRARWHQGGYPYAETLSGKVYDKALEALQIELVKLQTWIIETGQRLVIVFEGRDAAGKGGAIDAFRQYMSPRRTRIVALPKPTDVERGQWYFQRYVQHMPTSGDIVMFDRSWYNRAGVERVMGFCTPEQTKVFLREVPRFEDVLTDDGIILVKFYLEIGREMQLKQLHQRRHDPLKVWKISPIDLVAIEKYDDYTLARDEMLAASYVDQTPWTVILSNDRKRARLEAIRHVLRLFAYPGRDDTAIGTPDPKIIGPGGSFFAR